LIDDGDALPRYRTLAFDELHLAQHVRFTCASPGGELRHLAKK
jgi:hypothetical protein